MSRDIRDLSGPWKGLWVQRDVRGTMHQFRLAFDGDAITGGGQDRSGTFTMRGEYIPAGDRVVITKRYWHCKVRYEGVWNGSFVAGTSIIGPAWTRERGTFEMWPEDEEETFETAVAEHETHEPVTA